MVSPIQSDLHHKNRSLFILAKTQLLIFITLMVACTRATSLPEISPSPLPTWGPMPTRLPSPTPTSAIDIPLQTMRLALSRGDLIIAHTAWQEANAYAPGDGRVLQEGVRLALAQKTFAVAEARAWKAISARPKDAETWALLGTVLNHREEYHAADQAFAIAQTLDPTLSEALFTDRWHAARQTQDNQILQVLAQTYSRQFPGVPMTFYYQATALVAAGDPNSAIKLLVEVLEDLPDAPAALWMALGQAYSAREAWTEAVIALEVAGSKLAQGDRSLSADSENPAHALPQALAEAYIGAGQCTKAEPIYRWLSTPYPELNARVEAAILCQTPTPTWTPWIPSQQSTPTPIP
ncbi:MAG: hypothetical protein JXA33_06035 [Anaerolineae bacterium]|nr:hypothetical protein [Anaerolineae bacterium]